MTAFEAVPDARNTRLVADVLKIVDDVQLVG
jgi:hypothetical protein